MQKLNTYIINKENTKLEFVLNSEDSYLIIQSVFISSKLNKNTNALTFNSNIKLTAELKYIVYVDPQKRFIDERKKEFPIHLLSGLCQEQQSIHLNLMIKNETFTLGINPNRKFYKTLKLELHDGENFNEDYTLELNIEKFKIDD